VVNGSRIASMAGAYCKAGRRPAFYWSNAAWTASMAEAMDELKLWYQWYLVTVFLLVLFLLFDGRGNGTGE
jgi:hypothetical protein